MGARSHRDAGGGASPRRDRTQLIAEHGGYVFKVVGDAFCSAFARPPDALAAMVSAQQQLAAEDFSAVDGLRVRTAIHTGTADEREGDYLGPEVNRVARLLAIGHAGQVSLRCNCRTSSAASFAAAKRRCAI